MRRYRFTNPTPLVFLRLTEGVNARVHPADGHPATPHGTTITLRYGDEVQTRDPQTHAWLVEIEPPAKAAKPKKPKPRDPDPDPADGADQPEPDETEQS